MRRAARTDQLSTARADFETALQRLRGDLKAELGLSWQSVGVGVLVLAGLIGFGVARRLNDHRKAITSEDV